MTHDNASMGGPLSEAEQAAAKAIKDAYARAGWRMPDDFEDEARAVVAAVRPLIAAEAIENAAVAVFGAGPADVDVRNRLFAHASKIRNARWK